MPRWVLLVVTVLALAVATWWWTGYDSDERRIQRQVDRIMELVEKAPGESALAGLERARAIADLFATTFELRARPFDFHTRDRRVLAQAIQSYRAPSTRVWARASERSLQVDGENRRAILYLTARFGGDGPAFGDREAYRFQVNWVERDGTWRIDYVDLLEVIP